MTYFNKNLRQIKSLLKILTISLILLLSMSCSRHYDLLFINYGNDDVKIYRVSIRKNIAEVKSKQYIIIKAGFNNASGSVEKYTIYNKNGDVIMDFQINEKNLDKEYYLYDGNLIIIEIR